MTLQMYLLEQKMNALETVAIKLIHMGLNFADIQKATDLPIQRIEELAKEEANANHA